MSIKFRISHYDFDLNPAYPSKGAGRWIVRRHVVHSIDGVGHKDVEHVRSYAAKAGAIARTVRENRALLAEEQRLRDLMLQLASVKIDAWAAEYWVDKLVSAVALFNAALDATPAFDRALRATNGTRFGAILRCALGRNNPDAAPRFEGRATITSDGFTMCGFIDRDGRFHMGAFVGSASDLAFNVKGLSAHLKLDEAESAALSAAIKNWIGRDYRS